MSRELSRVWMPTPLKRRLKAEAASKGLKFQDYLVIKLGESAKEEEHELKRRFRPGLF